MTTKSILTVLSEEHIYRLESRLSTNMINWVISDLNK